MLSQQLYSCKSLPALKANTVICTKSNPVSVAQDSEHGISVKWAWWGFEQVAGATLWKICRKSLQNLFLEQGAKASVWNMKILENVPSSHLLVQQKERITFLESTSSINKKKKKKKRKEREGRKKTRLAVPATVIFNYKTSTHWRTEIPVEDKVTKRYVGDITEKHNSPYAKRAPNKLWFLWLDTQLARLGAICLHSKSITAEILLKHSIPLEWLSLGSDTSLIKQDRLLGNKGDGSFTEEAKTALSFFFSSPLLRAARWK